MQEDRDNFHFQSLHIPFTISYMLVRDKVKNRERFTPAENQISDYILDHTREVIEMPLDDLAKKLYVSKSTVIRFCKKLGFRGHKELCVQLAREMNSFIAGDEVTDAVIQQNDSADGIARHILSLKYRALTDTFNDLDLSKMEEAADLIARNHKVVIYGNSTDYPVQLELAARLRSINCDVRLPILPNTDLIEAASWQDDNVAIMLCYNGNSSSLQSVSEILRQKNIPIILLTGYAHTGLQKNATIVLHSAFHAEGTGVRALGSWEGMGLLADILYGFVFARDYEANMQGLKQQEAMLKNAGKVAQ